MKNRCFIFLLIMLLPSLTWAQTKNTATEVKDYREVDGKIILDLIVNENRLVLCWIWLDIRRYCRNM